MGVGGQGTGFVQLGSAQPEATSACTTPAAPFAQQHPNHMQVGRGWLSWHPGFQAEISAPAKGQSYLPGHQPEQGTEASPGTALLQHKGARGNLEARSCRQRGSVAAAEGSAVSR